jgi:hypothetical protein
MQTTPLVTNATADSPSSANKGATAGSPSSANKGATAGSPSSAKWVHAPNQAPTTAPTVLLAGPWHHAEFAAIRSEIDPLEQWPATSSLATAIAQLTSEPSPPDLILLAQLCPGNDDQEDIERLRRLTPLTRIIVVAGTWCEGELRTGGPLTGVIRLYWYELPAWWRANCRAYAANECPSWSEPLTELRPGQFIRLDAAVDSAFTPPAGVLAIDSIDYSVFEALKAGLATYGWTCIWQPRRRPQLNRDWPEQPTAALWDGGQLDDAELKSLAALCARLSPHNAPVIVLLDFPRIEHFSMAKAAGAGALMAKPYQLALLHNKLLRLTNAAAASSSR